MKITIFSTRNAIEHETQMGLIDDTQNMILSRESRQSSLTLIGHMMKSIESGDAISSLLQEMKTYVSLVVTETS